MATKAKSTGGVKTVKKHIVIIHSTEGKDGSGPVPLGIGSRLDHVPRDIKVYLTDAQLGVLQDAREKDFEVVQNTGQVRSYAGRQRYPFSNLGEIEVPLGGVSAASVEVPDDDDDADDSTGAETSEGGDGAAA